MSEIRFIIQGRITMGDLRRAEGSNSAAIDLMAKHACNEDGTPMALETFEAAVDDMEPLEFYELYARFNQAFVPKVRPRT